MSSREPNPLAGRAYIVKTYPISTRRRPVLDLLARGIEESGGRVVSCSFPEERRAPVYFGAESDDGHRYGLLTYPFTTTRRLTKSRSEAEHRFQVRFGDPVRFRREPNPLARDPAGVDVTLVLAVDPERDLIVGLDPMVYSELPIGVSGYYRDEQANAAAHTSWSAWAKERSKPRSTQGPTWDGLESMVGFTPDRLLSFARFEGLATSLGLDTGLRIALAERFAAGDVDRHSLERLFGIDAATILDIVEANFRLGVAVRGSVAEHHLGKHLAADPSVVWHQAIDEDGKPDFCVLMVDGTEVTIECKNALRETYKGGDAKVETQKTRDSGAGRKYTFDAFDVIAACMFSVTGRWTFKFKRAADLVPWANDPTRIGAIQRIDDTWADSIGDLALEPAC